jgi:pyruvate formate lyase activating enzyme
LKAFTADFYRRVCGGSLSSVLETLEYIVHETHTWLEITTLLIPGYNDSAAEITALSKWVARHLGCDVPLHFSAFHPDWKLTEPPRTPPATLSRARALARAEGLHYVYTGNVHDVEGGSTYCPRCAERVIQRDWYDIEDYRLDIAGGCPRCGLRVAGHFAAHAGSWGRKRQLIRIE